MTITNVLLYSLADETDASLDAWSRHLDHIERDHFRKRGHGRALHGSLVGRALLRRELAHTLGCAPPEVPLARTAEGKPYVATTTEWDFNVAHSGRYIALAFSRSGPVGVDIEWRARRARIDALAQQYFGTRELSNWRELPSGLRRYRFFQLWTLKEAIAKARGASIWTTLTRTQWTRLEHGDATVELTGEARKATPMAWWHVDLGADYSLSVVQLRTTASRLSLAQLDRDGGRWPLECRPDVSGSEPG